MSRPAGESGHARAPHPALNAMLICDTAIREAGTGKVTLVGIFNRLGGPQFPLRHGQLAVYAKITDAEGAYHFALEVIRLEDEVTIARLEVDVSVADRMSANELIFAIAGLGFDRPGRHEFRLSANGRHVGGTLLDVVRLEPG